METSRGDRPSGAGADPRWSPRQPEPQDDTAAAAFRDWHFGNERWMLSQVFAARIEVARRDPSAAARAGVVAALAWQRAEAMRAVAFRQHAETVTARLRRSAKRRDGLGPASSQRPK